MKNKKTLLSSDLPTTSLPKTLWGFYFKYATHGHVLLLISWAITFLLAEFEDLVWPLTQRWIVAIFETPVPMGMTMLQHALPTILRILVIFLSLDIMRLVRQTLRGRLHPVIRNQISQTLNDYAQHQSMQFWTGGMSGKVFSQINYVSDGFMVIESLWKMIVVVGVIIINAGMIFQINPWIALIFAVSFVLRFLYSWLLIKPMNRAAEEASSANSALSGQVIDSISNYYIVKLFAAADKEKRHLLNPREKQIKTAWHSAFVQRLFWGVPMFLWDALFCLMLVLCCQLFAKGQMKVSDVVFTISVYCTIMGLIGFIVNQIPDVTDRIASANKAYKELVVPIVITDAPDAKPLNVKRGKIEIKNLSFKYRNKNKYILHDLSLTIKPGERIGIVGPSGAGKTTLVNLLMRFYEPDHGGIFIDGQDIRTVTQNSLRENISFIPQTPTMFNRSIRDNIAYGKENATDEEIHRAARLASADKFIRETEKQYDSWVGDRGIKLSGGQCQRIAIARAFLKNAPILILDEATSALDSETEVAIQKSFNKLSSGRTTIAIAHRLSTLRNMDRIIVLNKGRIIEQGSHASLLRKKGEYARLWNMQSGGFLQEK